MVDHSEFPWGPDSVPALLTPLGIAGWIAALFLLIVLLRSARGGELSRTKITNAVIETIYDLILKAARYALAQSDFGILQGADILRRTIQGLLGGVLQAGGGIAKHMKKIGEALGEGEDKKKAGDKKADAHGPGHGATHVKHDHGHADLAAAAVSTVTETVHGHSITLNIGNEKCAPADHASGHDGHGSGHDGHGDDHGCPPTLEEQLILVRKTVREFEIWWSDRPSRLAELLAAREDLTTVRKLDPKIAALLEEKK